MQVLEMQVVEMPGIIFFAHGSSVESANQAVRNVAAEAARQAGIPRYEVAFLELGAPTLEQAVDTLVAAGIKRITVVPYFLTLGIHLQRDLPAIVGRISAAHSGIEITVTPPLDGHPGLAGVLADRARNAMYES
jgi:sirohydrochlorin ferrochelatase